MKRYLALLLIILFFSQKSSAQRQTTEELLSVKLPLLDTLFERAKKSSMIEYYEYELDRQELELKTEKKSWLSYFGLYGSYSYGVIGTNSYTNLGSNFPLIYQNSGGEQLWYNAGVSVGIPLDKFFDRRNRLKIQKLKIMATLKQREMWYDQQKIKILELYDKAQRILSELELYEESAVLAKAQFTLVEKDFIMGKATPQDLSTAKSFQVQTLFQLEDAKSELRVAIMTLEVLSNTKILTK